MVPAFRQLIFTFLHRCTPAFWGMVVLQLVLLVMAVLLYQKWQHQSAQEAREATQNGQRVFINVADGAISGHLYQQAKTTAPEPVKSPTAVPENNAGPLLTDTLYKDQKTVTTDAVQAAANQSALKLLNDAPLPVLQQDGAQGKLPIMSADGMTAWRQYGRGLVADKGLPRIMVVLSGLGLSQSVTAGALENLPPEVSVSFSPYAQDLAAWEKFARAKGHELWVDLPLEPRDYPVSDPGPFGLNRREPEEENIRRLHWAMTKVQAAVGFIANEEENFFSQSISGRPVAQEIAMRGLLLAYTNPKAVVSVSAVKLPETAPEWKALRVQQQLGNSPSKEAVEGFFRGLEAQARESGSAVGVMPALPLVLENFKQWQATLVSKGIVLAPLTSYLTSPYVKPPQPVAIEGAKTPTQEKAHEQPAPAH